MGIRCGERAGCENRNQWGASLGLAGGQGWEALGSLWE